jgi:hypothetical protein
MSSKQASEICSQKLRICNKRSLIDNELENDNGEKDVDDIEKRFFNMYNIYEGDVF